MSESDRAILAEVLQQQWQQDRPGLKDLDTYFENFSAEQILKSLAFDLDSQQIDSGMVGGGGEGGIDSWFLFANKRLINEDTDLSDFKGQQLALELVLIQSKNQDKFGEAALLKFSDLAKNCLKYGADLAAAAATGLYSERLLGKVKQFHDLYKPTLKPTARFRFYYASMAEHVDPKVSARRDMFISQLQELYTTATCECEFVGAGHLWKWYNKPSGGPIPLECSRVMKGPHEGKSYVGFVPLSTFNAFITFNGKPRASLFESNVRDHHPDATVNNKIAATLDSPGSEDFWWLNNGVTIIAADIGVDETTLTITDPLIVNGLQTSYEIFNYFQRRTAAGIDESSRVDSRNILVRVVKVGDPVSIDNIINATNSQTTIPSIWLHATEEIHRRIEVLLKTVGLFYDRRKNFYKNRGKSTQEIVTIPYLAQALVAIVLQKPDESRGRPTSVAEKHYKSLFGDEMPEGVYVKAVQALKIVDKYLDACWVDRSTKSNVIYHVAMHAVCSALKSARPRRTTIAALDLDRITDSILDDSFLAVLAIYNHLGKTDQIAKGKVFAEEVRKSLAKYSRYPGVPEPIQKQAPKRNLVV